MCLRQKLIKWLGGVMPPTPFERTKILHITHTSIPIKVGVRVPVDDLFGEEEADEYAKEEMTRLLAEYIIENNLMKIEKEKSGYNSHDYFGTIYLVKEK